MAPPTTALQSDPDRMTRVQIFLSGCAVALFAILGWLTDWGQGFSEPEISIATGNGKVEMASVLPDFKLSSDASAYAQVTDRPLLNPTRRPAPTQPITALAPEPPKPQIRRGLYQLLGVTDLGGAKVAQVRDASTSRVRSVRVGDALQEMKVAAIDTTQMILAFQGETDVLELAKFTPSGRIPVPAPINPTPIGPIAGLPSAAVLPPTPTTPPSAVERPSSVVGILPIPPAVNPTTQPSAIDGAAPARTRMTVRERLDMGRNRTNSAPPTPTPQ
jgi:hypothetical protein